MLPKMGQLKPSDTQVKQPLKAFIHTSFSLNNHFLSVAITKPITPKYSASITFDSKQPCQSPFCFPPSLYHSDPRFTYHSPNFRSGNGCTGV